MKKVNTKMILRILKFTEDRTCPKDVILECKGNVCPDCECTKCWIESIEGLNKHVDLEVL